MKQAKAGDWLRRLGNAEKWPTKIVKLNFSGVTGFGDENLTLRSQLTLLCGANGVGKSSILQIAWAAADPTSWAASRERNTHLASGKATLTCEANGKVIEQSIDFANFAGTETNETFPSSQFLIGWRETGRYQESFLASTSCSEIVEGFAEYKLDESELGEICFLTSRDYDRVTLYEVEVGSDESPFFEVSYGGQTYDSRHMGTGEICLFHIWWRLRRANVGEILFIEEPEAFVSYGSQLNLSMVITKVAVEKKLSCLISSHSPAFMSWFGKDLICFMSRGSAGLSIIEGDVHPRLLGQLGINQNLKAIAFVEDELAKTLLVHILERQDPVSRAGIFVAHKGGNGEITNALRALGRVKLPVRFIGVFDGDQQNQIPEDVAAVSTWLPGEKAFEKIVRDFVVANPEEVGRRVNSDKVAQILNGLEGKENHEWYAGLAGDLAMTRAELFQAVVALWYAEPANETQVSDFIQRVYDLLAGG